MNTPVSAPGPLEGTWSVSPGIGADDASASWIGYRVNEHLVGITNTIVGAVESGHGDLHRARHERFRDLSQGTRGEAHDQQGAP